MKIVTVRDLRNRFADVSKAIELGETVSITRRGALFATLAPAAAAKSKKPKKADWAATLAKRRPLGRPLNAEETAAFWSQLRD